MTTAIPPLTQAHIYAQKKDAGAQLKIDAGFAALGFGVAAVTAAFFPPMGIVGLVGMVIGLSNTIDATRDVARIHSLKKSEQELSEGKLEDTKKRAETLGKVGVTGRRIALVAVAAALGGLVTALAAPAVLPMAAASAFLSAVAWPALGLLAVSRVVEGTAEGARNVVSATEATAPAAAAPAAAPEATPAKPSRFAALKNLFQRSAVPANDDTKPATPQAAAPAKPEAPKQG